MEERAKPPMPWVDVEGFDPDPPRPWGDHRFATGNTLTALVKDPRDLLECYEQYEAKCTADETPISVYGFLAFAKAAQT